MHSDVYSIRSRMGISNISKPDTKAMATALFLCANMASKSVLRG